MHSSSSWVATITEWVLWVGVVLVVIFALPLFINFLISSKILVILLAAISVVALFLYQSSLQKNLTFVHHPLTAPLFLFGLAVGLSTFLAGSYPVENLLGWGGVYLAAVVIAILGGSLLPKDAATRFMPVVIGTTIVLSLATLLQLAGFGPSRILNALFQIQLPNSGVFNLIGSPFIAAQFFGVITVALGVSGFYRKQFTSLDLAGLAFAVIGLISCLYLILPGKEGYTQLLPLGASWSIALDTLHNFRAALVGIGPEQYSAAYAQFRPAWINGQSWWNILFIQAANLPLTLIVTTGFIGLLSWLYFLARLVMEGIQRDNLKNPVAVLAVSIGLLNVLLPASVVLIAVQAVALAVWIASQRSNANLFTIHFFHIYTSGGSNRNTFPLNKAIGLILVLLVMGFGLYGIGRVYASSYAFYRGSVALAQNDAVNGYTLQQRAVILNPYDSSYRSGYALTNMGIALALSNKADLTEEEQTQITQLIQQSIREARAATVLRPDMATNWQILAQIYRNLIGSAEGADQWTITSYVNAIERAPTDPLLRLELGQVFFQLKQYREAVNLFTQAAELKPDLVNAYYNGANALEELGELTAAEQTYQRTLELLRQSGQESSEDYVLASQELEALQAKIKDQAEAQGDEDEAEADSKLSVPSITEQNLNQQSTEVITQPEADQLNVNEPIPTPVPSPSVTVSPSPSPQP